MPLILAIEPGRRQAARVAALARTHLAAEIVVVDSVPAALDALKTARPDLVLTPLLLSAKDDAALTARLRELDSDGIELQTLVIPVLASGDAQGGETEKHGAGILTRLRKQKSTNPALVSEGCDPAVFAAQIAEYLARIAADRHDREEARRALAWSEPQTSTSAPMLGELLTMTASQMLPLAPDVMMGFEEAMAIEPEFVPDDVAAPVTVEHVGINEVSAPEISAISAEPVEEVAEAMLDVSSIDDANIPAAPFASELVTHVEPAVMASLPHEEEAIELPTPNLLPTPDSAGVTDDDEGHVEAPWEDLEPFFEDLESERTVEQAHPVAAMTDDDVEPDAVEVTASDELWAPLERAQQQTIAPIEGPVLKRRRTAPAKTPKAPRAKTAKARVAKPRRAERPKTPQRPMQDEWGLYDPEQCGFAALLERLDELTETEKRERETERRSAIMRR